MKTNFKFSLKSIGGSLFTGLVLKMVLKKHFFDSSQLQRVILGGIQVSCLLFGHLTTAREIRSPILIPRVLGASHSRKLARDFCGFVRCE